MASGRREQCLGIINQAAPCGSTTQAAQAGLVRRVTQLTEHILKSIFGCFKTYSEKCSESTTRRSSLTWPQGAVLELACSPISTAAMITRSEMRQTRFRGRTTGAVGPPFPSLPSDPIETGFGLECKENARRCRRSDESFAWT
jgi:hypothetical protein